MSDQIKDLPTEASDEISLLDLLQVVVENLRLLIFGPLIAGLAALGISYLIPPTFIATTTFLPPQQQQSAAAAMLQSLGAVGGLGAAVSGIRNPSDQYVALAGSRSVEDVLVDKFELIKRYDVEFRQDARKRLEESTRISSGRDGLIKIEVEDKDPKIAADIANAYVSELSRLMNRIAVTEAQQRRVFFERQWAQAKDELIKAETALKGTGIGESALRSNPQTAVGSVASLMAQVTAKEVQLGAMRNYLSDAAPEFKRAQSELAALKGQLTRAEKDVPASTGGGDYVSKFRDFKYHETLFDLMAKQYEIAKIDESREGAVIQVVDVAVMPERKSKPRKAIIAVLVTLSVAFLLLIYIFVRNAWIAAANQPETAFRISKIKDTLGIKNPKHS